MFFTKKLLFTIASAFIAVSLAACASTDLVFNSSSSQGSAAPTARPTEQPRPTSPLAQYYIPSYYSSSYVNLVRASKEESKLIIYSTLSDENWKPILDTFQSHYPWIKVSTVQLGATAALQTYRQETQQNALSADIIISPDAGSWYQFAQQDNIFPYTSQEDIYLSSWNSQVPGLYTLSADPGLIIYNQDLTPNPPHSMQDLADLIAENPQAYQQRIITCDIENNPAAMDLDWFWIKVKAEAGWKIFNDIGRTAPILTTDKNTAAANVGSGKARLGYFINSAAVFSQMAQYPNLKFSYIKDGQPVYINYIAITNTANHLNSARLMLDFLLSQEGQIAESMGGLTALRPDVTSTAQLHINKVQEEVGSENLIFVNLDTSLTNQAKTQAFLARWSFYMRKQFSPAAP